MKRSHVLFAALLLGLAALAGAQSAPAPSPVTPATPSPTTTPANDRVVVDAKTEQVIKGALRFLAAKQTPTGAWSGPNGDRPIAITGYTLMAFLAAGELPMQGEYGKQVKRGTDFLLSCSHEDGYLSSDDFRLGKIPSNMYDHGIGSIALGEIYGQTPDPRVGKALAASVQLIVKSQNIEGGWRYDPKPTDADISVTVLQVVALRVAKNGGIAVPQDTIDRAVQYVKRCVDPATGGFNYQAKGDPKPGFARTAAAIYSLQVCGQYDDPLVARGSQYLFTKMASGNGPSTAAGDREWYSYGNFYAAPAQYMIGGATWENWYSAIKSQLLNSVVTESGVKPVSYWAGLDSNRSAYTGGNSPVYYTAVYTMILAMPYHYVPLYQR